MIAPEPLALALNYIARGWNPVPVKWKSKVPSASDDWQNLHIDAESAPKYFNNGPQNVGVQLGAKSGGLADVDCDSGEAITIARYLLPPTPAIFGRPTMPLSHYLYVTDLCQTHDTATIQFNNADAMLIELRIGGIGKGAQTVFPGSVHESGETIAWASDGEPAKIDGDVLLRRVKRIAAAALLARHWPAEGARHNAAPTVGGFLARAGLGIEEIASMVEAIAVAASDPEARDRVRAAEDQAKHHAETKRGRGLPELIKVFGEEISRRVANWLEYKHVLERDALGAKLAEARTAIIPVGEWVREFGKAADPLIEDADEGEIIGRGQQGVLFGLQGTGKTSVAIEMALAIATGAGMGRAPLASEPLFRSQKGRVLVAIYEDRFDYRRRLIALAKTRGADLDALNWGMVGADQNITRDRDRAALLQQIRDDTAVNDAPALLVVDTVAAALGAESANDDDVVGKLFSISQTLTREFQTTVIFIAHPGKDESRGIAGSYRFQGNSDFILRTVETKDGFRLIKDKDRNGPKRPLFDYTLDYVEVERTASGKPRTGAIIGMMTACMRESFPQHTKPKERIPRALRIFRSAMQTALAAHGVPIQPDNETAVQAVAKDRVRAAFRVAYGGQAAAQKNAFRRALNAELDRGFIAAREIDGAEHLWRQD